MNNKRKSVGGGGINKMKYGTALVLANDVIFLAIPRLSKDCVNSETWSRSQLSASQCMFSDYGPRLCLSL